LDDILGQYISGNHIARLSLTEFGRLHSALRKASCSTGDSAHFPTSGQLSDKIQESNNIRKIRPFIDIWNETVAERFFKVTNGRLRSAPILPGLLAHLIEFAKGGHVAKHEHPGLEIVFALKGTVAITFQDTVTYELESRHHDVILYNSEIEHEARSEQPSAILVGHFEGSLMRRWTTVLRWFARAESTDQVPPSLDGAIHSAQKEASSKTHTRPQSVGRE
jgi:quercetin dioxygenase-like cupin family protein